MDWHKGDLVEDHGHEKHFAASFGTSLIGTWVEVNGEFIEIIDIERM